MKGLVPKLTLPTCLSRSLSQKVLGPLSSQDGGGWGHTSTPSDGLAGHKQAPAWLTLPLSCHSPRPVPEDTSIRGHEEAGDGPS